MQEENQIVEKKVLKPTKRMVREKGNYVSNKDLLQEILISKEKGKLTDYAVKMLMKMANEATKLLKYKYPQDREDVVAFAIMDCVAYWRGFKPEISSNAFSYFTQIIKNGATKGFNKLHPVKDSKMISVSKDAGFYNL